MREATLGTSCHVPSETNGSQFMCLNIIRLDSPGRDKWCADEPEEGHGG